jgi:hypothetical protein
MVKAIGRKMDQTPPCAAPPMPFIVGSPRSGTTLLRLMVDSHPEMAIPPETGFLMAFDGMESASAIEPSTLLRILTQFPADAPVWPDFQIAADALGQRLERLRPLSISGGLRAFYQMYAERFGKVRWGDKTPAYIRSMKAIEAILPEARFIHLVRDGRDVAVSLRERWFSPGHDIEIQAVFWRDNVLAGCLQGHDCRHYLEVRFEDLVQNPEVVLRGICDFIELPYSSQMLRYDERAAERLREHGARHSPSGVEIVSVEERQRQQQATCGPLMRDRIGVWRRALTADECQRFDAVAGDVLERFGYRSVAE